MSLTSHVKITAVATYVYIYIYIYIYSCMCICVGFKMFYLASFVFSHMHHLLVSFSLKQMHYDYTLYVYEHLQRYLSDS